MEKIFNFPGPIVSGPRLVLFSFYFYRSTPMLASGIKGMRIQLRFGSAYPGSTFMRRRLGCPTACCAGAPLPFRMKNPKKTI
jgi:hypothetical protein